MKTPPFHAKTGLPSAEQATILAEEFGLKLAA